jgi:hypothetical protein
MKTFDNKGNHFFIEIIPDINDKGAWKGQYQMAIQARRLNLDDDSFFALEQLCQMACASISLMEEDPAYRKKIYDYLHEEYTVEDSSDVSSKRKVKVDKVNDNVITINFSKETPKGNA